jgi:hypothetical protein
MFFLKRASCLVVQPRQHDDNKTPERKQSSPWKSGWFMTNLILAWVETYDATFEEIHIHLPSTSMFKRVPKFWSATTSWNIIYIYINIYRILMEFIWCWKGPHVPALCWPRLRLQLVPAHGRPTLDTPMIDPSVPQETCHEALRCFQRGWLHTCR